MKQPLSFLLRKTPNLHEQQIPGARLARVQQALKRRLDDDILEVFERACAGRDLDSAADLLALLEKRHARRAATYGRERRISDALVQRARRDLERIQMLNGGQSASASL